jgi:basic membrane lipoprotein Med (substrate-binding protein (PBP1-ABC) superfamily)
MTAASEDEINDWIQAIGDLHANVATDAADEATAQEAMANVWSAFGYREAPDDVLRMFVQATEIGYVTALRDVRDGKFDDQLAEWRPAD